MQKRFKKLVANDFWKMAFIFAISVLFFAGDRFLKYFLLHRLSNGEFLLLGKWLKIKLSANAGIAFGIPLNQGLILFFYVLIILLFIFILIFSYRREKKREFLCSSLIICGAVSNFIDRLRFGAVIDYVDAAYFSVFNLADAMIVFGVFGLIGYGIFRRDIAL